MKIPEVVKVKLQKVLFRNAPIHSIRILCGRRAFVQNVLDNTLNVDTSCPDSGLHLQRKGVMRFLMVRITACYVHKKGRANRPCLLPINDFRVQLFPKLSPHACLSHQTRA
jgi:hypothetical protein